MTRTASLRVYTPGLEGSREPVPGFVRSYAMLSEDGSTPVWTVEWEGRRLTCPSNLRLRVLESTVAFANAFAGMGAGLIPEEAADAADRELRRYHAEHPSHRSQVLTSAWHVPVRWFACFSPDEAETYPGEDGPQLRFRTGLVSALERARHAHQVLDDLGVFPGPAAELGQLIDWLEPFPAGSMLELDYGDVSRLFEPGDLVLDDSCEVVQESIAALAEGDMMRAGECYGRVVSRWAPAFSVTFSN